MLERAVRDLNQCPMGDGGAAQRDREPGHPFASDEPDLDARAIDHLRHHRDDAADREEHAIERALRLVDDARRDVAVTFSRSLQAGRTLGSSR